MSTIQSETALPPLGFEPRYSAGPEYISELTRLLLQTGKPQTNTRYACYRVDGTDETSNLGRIVELNVFRDKFNNNETQLHEEYGPYETASSFLLLLDRKDVAMAGALRVIKNGSAGLKTLNDISKPPVGTLKSPCILDHPEEFLNLHGIENLDTTRDVGTLVVERPYRKQQQHLASATLYRALEVDTRNQAVKHLVSAVDKPVYNTLRLLGMPFEPIKGSGPFPYIDSAQSLALYGYAPDFMDAIKGNYKRALVTNPLKALLLARPTARITCGFEIDKSLVFKH